MFTVQILTQTDDHNLKKNVTTNKNYIPRKMGLKSQNPKFNIFCKIAFRNKQK